MTNSMKLRFIAVDQNRHKIIYSRLEKLKAYELYRIDVMLSFLQGKYPSAYVYVNFL